MPRKRRNRKFIQMQVSEDAHKVIRQYKRGKEPLSDVLDRMLGNYLQGDKAQLQADLDEAQEKARIFATRYIELKEQLEIRGQMTLI